MKVLVVRFSSIGDIVLTTPVVRCLKRQLGAEIHYLAKKNFEKILLSNPNIDRVFSIQKDIKEVISDLKSMNYDYVIDLHNNLRTWHLKFLLGKKSHSFNKLNLQKWLLVNLKINWLPNIHIVERYLKTIEPLGAKNDGLGLDYFIPKEDEIVLPNEKIGHPLRGYDYVAMVIGAAHATKRLPISKIVELCNQIKLPIILLGGKEDFVAGEDILTKATGKVINLCGKLNLNQSASIVRQAYKVVTHDTGLMHIAAAFHKDIISIWGNTVPVFGMTPYLVTEQSKIFEVKEVRCRPCSKIGYESCPKKHFSCMNLQDSKEIANAINI